MFWYHLSDPRFVHLYLLIHTQTNTQVQGLARDFLKDYIQVTVGSLELTASKHIEQIVEVIDDFEKANRIFKILDGVKEMKKMVENPCLTMRWL